MKPENNNDKKNDEKIVFINAPLSAQATSLFLSDMKEIPSMLIGDYKYALELDETAEILEIARKELRETPENIQNALEKLKKLLEKEENLHVPIEKDKFLIRFLRPCKFYPESAFELIKRYYKFKVKYADVYDGLKPSNERRIFEQNILIFQQERDQFGRRILTIKLGENWDPDKVTLDEFFKGTVLLVELGVLEPITQICGAVIILDMKGLTLQQTTKFTPMFIKRLLDWLQDSIPVRIKNFHIVNQPYVFKIVYKLIKMFLREKLRKRIIFHGDNMKSLQKYIDVDCLLEEYGGKVRVPQQMKGNPWLELLLKCDEEYQVINTYGYNRNNEEINF